MTSMAEFEGSVQALAERVGPAVVGLGHGWRGGSGVVVRSGLVLTAAYSARHEDPRVVFADGREETGTLAGTDPHLGLSGITVDTGDVEPVTWVSEEAEEVSLGRAVFALANPGGRGLRVTPGFVSSSSRSFRGGRGRRIRGAIEHTAPLPRGSAGGPLVDREGRLLGVNAFRVDPGLILAIPAGSKLRDRVELMARGEQVPALRLGVALAPPRVARRLRGAVGLPDQPGLLIRAVEPGSAAERAGLTRGDLIVAAQSRLTEGLEALYEALDSAAQNGSLELRVVRGTEPQAVTVTWGEATRS